MSESISSSSTSESCQMPSSPKPTQKRKREPEESRGEVRLATFTTPTLQALVLDESCSRTKRILSQHTVKLDCLSPTDIGPIDVPLERQRCNILSNYIVYNLVCDNEINEYGIINREFFDRRSLGHSFRTARINKNDSSFLQTREIVYGKPVKSMYLNWVNSDGMRQRLSPQQAEPVLFEWYRNLLRSSYFFRVLKRFLSDGKTVVISGPTSDVVSPSQRKSVTWSESADPVSLFCWEEVIVELLRESRK